ncbi:MAG: sigma-70 family RNA polymerase sigma factor [Ruminococcaceae bacterium]|jgi:RNA polymerase sigma-70 factor (ECF subfamily)|nr:sigma-70 family RNA polymerase sigma factor [Oscillospiraceae bacterium]
MEEKELIQACQKGDEAAFEELIRLHEKKVFALCRRMCRDEDDALEAAQDTFLAVWRGIGSYRADAAFSTWLYRLASNACLDLLRREKKHGGNVSLDDEEARIEPSDPAPQPEEALERAETQRMVREALYALPDDYRQVLLLRETEQLSYNEIAEATGLELGTVKSRISRARLALRNYLAASGNFFERAASKKAKEA